MVPFFVQIKCQLGKSYEVANRLADAEVASEIYSTAGEFDLLVKVYVDTGVDIGHFVNEKIQVIPGIRTRGRSSRSRRSDPPPLPAAPEPISTDPRPWRCRPARRLRRSAR